LIFYMPYETAAKERNGIVFTVSIYSESIEAWI
jgi:hypothetical protein